MCVLRRILRGEAGKGVSGAGGYIMGYYTIWLAPVKKFLAPFWELEIKERTSVQGAPEEWRLTATLQVSLHSCSQLIYSDALCCHNTSDMAQRISASIELSDRKG